MKRIIVFGATGGTGKELVMQALEQGYEVTAVVRNPDTFTMQHPHLTISKGDVLQPITFEYKLQSADAVISCLGAAGTKPTTLYSDGIMNIITAMQKGKVKRLVCISALPLYLNNSMGIRLQLLIKLFLAPIFKNLYSDMRLMETRIMCSNLNWTIVRPPYLINKPLTGIYRTATHVHLKKPWSISRADLAHFMLSTIDNPETIQSKTEISY